MTDELTAELTENVKRGIDFLNRTKSTNWPFKVNWSDLHMDVCTACVWGQLNECNGSWEYTDTLEDAGVTDLFERINYGFELDTHGRDDWTDTEIDDAWQLLGDAWKAEVAKLMEGVPAWTSKI